PGISEEDQKRVFEKYANISSQPTNNEKSTGIGLFSVKKSVDSLKGTIELHNNPGKGATFVCQFPVNS
ncbi:ATP-binding protein, partial [Arthrospira platensis SPKY1]|nr:ATP-binding protein [Arthrospira platensis SPKY1]